MQIDSVSEDAVLDMESKIAKLITDNCTKLNNININNCKPKVSNHGNEVIIDFKAILLTFKKIEGINEDLLKQSYEALIRMTIPITNDAITKAIDKYGPQCNMDFSYEEDLRTGVYKITVGVRNLSECGIVNEIGMEDYKCILESERDDTKFEYYSSNTFLADAARGDSPRKMRKYASRAEKFLKTTGAKIEVRPYKMNGYKHQFNINYTNPASIIKGGINKIAYKVQTKSMTMFTKAQIESMKKKTIDNINRLNKMADQLEHKLKHESAVMTIDKVLTEATEEQLSKNYTSIPISYFTKTLPDAKKMYLDMNKIVTSKYSTSDGIYTPGWDPNDWPDPPDKFFDRMSKYSYGTTYNGHKYGQFSIVIAEVDNAKRKLAQIKEILAMCEKQIMPKYKMDKIPVNSIGWYVCPIVKNNGYMIAICLNSNDALIE